MNTKRLTTTAMMTAFTCLATMLIKIPTPISGYIHMGDALVLLCAVLIQRKAGAFAAGAGSALADLSSGFAIWAPGTFIIKAFAAYTAWLFYSRSAQRKGEVSHLTLIAGSLFAAFIITAGYYIWDIVVLTLASGADNIGFYAAATASLAEIPFNIIQSLFGALVTIIIAPKLSRLTESI